VFSFVSLRFWRCQEAAFIFNSHVVSRAVPLTQLNFIISCWIGRCREITILTPLLTSRGVLGKQPSLPLPRPLSRPRRSKYCIELTLLHKRSLVYQIVKSPSLLQDLNESPYAEKCKGTRTSSTIKSMHTLILIFNIILDMGVPSTHSAISSPRCNDDNGANLLAV
jgi:hypothetical protein